MICSPRAPVPRRRVRGGHRSSARLQPAPVLPLASAAGVCASGGLYGAFARVYAA
jgi:hypothetical protein